MSWHVASMAGIPPTHTATTRKLPLSHRCTHERTPRTGTHAHTHRSNRTDELSGTCARQKPFHLLRVAVARQVVDEELRVGQVRQAEGRVRGRELLVHDARGAGIHAGTAIIGVDGDSEEAELTSAAKEGGVECLVAIVLERLRFHLAGDKRRAELTESAVLLRRVE